MHIDAAIITDMKIPYMRAKIRLHTKKAVQAYNDYFDSDKEMGDEFIVSYSICDSFKEILRMRNLMFIVGCEKF